MRTILNMKNPPVAVLILSLLCTAPLWAQNIVGTPAKSSCADSIYEEGCKSLDQGKAEEAYGIFMDGLTTFPEEVRILLGAGKAALLAGYTDKSVALLFKAVEAAPDSARANLYLGMALRQQGQEMASDLMTQNDGYMMIGDSLQFFNKAVELEEKDPEPCLELAYTLNFLGDMEAADEAAREALKRSPGLIEALLLRGDLAYLYYRRAGASGEPASEVRALWQHAMDLYKEAAHLHEDHAGAFLGMAALYESDKKWKESAQTYREALKRDPELLQGYNRLITLFRREDAMNEEDGSLVGYVEEVLEEVKRKYPKDRSRTATALYYLAFALFLDFEFEKSIEVYAESASLNPDYQTTASYYISRASYELGDRDRSVEELLALIAQDPEGLAYSMQGDNEFMSKGYPSISGLAFYLVQNERLDDARLLNLQLLKAIENDPSLYNNYAFLCRETGRYEESFGAYQKALALDPTNPTYLNDAALILHYHLHRDLDEAERMYKQAAEEAQRIIDEGEANEMEIESAKIALRDSQNNLILLRAGILDEREGDPPEEEEEGKGESS